MERTSELRRRSAHEGYKARGIDDTASLVEALGGIYGIVSHGDDGVLAPPPDALEVDLHSEVPDAFFRVERGRVMGMHDS